MNLDRAWNQYSRFTFIDNFPFSLFSLSLSSLRPPPHRTISTAPYRLFRSGVELIEKNLCVSCWLLKNCCMCSSLHTFECRHKIFILMHHKEFGRGSNTGKLAVRASHATTKKRSSDGDGSPSASSPSSSSSPTDLAFDPIAFTSSSALVQLDIPEQERALQDLCQREPLNTIVLFPSEDAMSVEEFAKLRGWSLPTATTAGDASNDSTTTATVTPPTDASSAPSSSSPPSSSSSASPSTLSSLPPLNIILLDGTWRQARGMKYQLPSHIPCIKIDPFVHSLTGTLRIQTEDMKEQEAEERKKVEKEEERERKAHETTTTTTTTVDATVTAESSGSTPSTSSTVDQSASGSVPVPASSVASPTSSTPASLPVHKPKTNSRPKKPIVSQRDPSHLDGKVLPPPSSSSSSESGNVKTFVSLFYPLRRQSQPDRISTVEALVILLKELKESDQVTHRLLDLLRVRTQQHHTRTTRRAYVRYARTSSTIGNVFSY